MIPDASKLIAYATTASQLVLVVAVIAFVRLYFVPEYGVYVFARRWQKSHKSTLRLILCSVEHVPPLEAPTFRVCLRSLERLRVTRVRAFAGAWLNLSASRLMNPSEDAELAHSHPYVRAVELILVLHGIAGGGSIRLEIDVETPDSTSGDVRVDVELYSVSGATQKSAVEVMKERGGLAVRRFDVKSRKYGRTMASLVLGFMFSAAVFVYSRLVVVPLLLQRESVADKMDDASVWDICLFLALLLFALEFAIHRLRAGYPFRSTTCGYQESKTIWPRELPKEQDRASLQKEV